MATYAAYRHIELDKVGAGKKRVLKPPGGGTSDIFGSSDSEKTVVRKNDTASTNGGSSSSSSSTSSSSSNISTTFENGHSADYHQDTAEKKTNSKLTTPTASTASRGRVPPGGYSSGLW